jgi:FkbM family methyltransferase
MSLSNFIYRQKQKLKYHLADNNTDKLIAEINRFEERVKINKHHYYLNELKLEIPHGKFDFIFFNYPLFLSNAQNLSGQYVVDGDALIFQWEDFKIYISSASEIFIINEIFVERCYQFKSPKDGRDIVVFDIGMNVGLASLFFAKMTEAKKIYAFEPFKPTYDKAIKNFKLNAGLTNKVQTFNFGLGGEEKELQVPYSELNTGINSSVNPSSRKLDSSSSETIQIKEVYSQLDILVKENFDAKVILKIDTEGAEFEIFERLSKERIWEQVSLIMMEWHYKSPSDIEACLTENGFTILTTILNKQTGLIYAFRTK